MEPKTGAGLVWPDPAARCSGAGINREGPMAINRNILFLLIGALLVGVGALGYELYREKQDDKGVHIRLGPLKIDGSSK